MEKVELVRCLEKFYLGARQKEGSFYKSSSLRSIRGGLNRYLQSPEVKISFSIITNPAFVQANKALDAFLKTLRKDGEIAGVVHKETLTREVVKKLFEIGQILNLLVSSRTRFGSTLPFILAREAAKIKERWRSRCSCWEQLPIGGIFSKSTVK